MPKQSKPTLHLPAITGDPGADLRMLIALFTKLTGREPTPAEIAEARADLQAPHAPPTADKE